MQDYYFIDAEELKKRITSKCKDCIDNGNNWCTHICDVHDILEIIDDMIEEVNSEIENPKDIKKISKLKRLEYECEELMKFYDKQSLAEWIPEARNIDKEKAECYRHLIECIHELKK